MRATSGSGQYAATEQCRPALSDVRIVYVHHRALDLVVNDLVSTSGVRERKRADGQPEVRRPQAYLSASTPAGSANAGGSGGRAARCTGAVLTQVTAPWIACLLPVSASALRCCLASPYVPPGGLPAVPGSCRCRDR